MNNKGQTLVMFIIFLPVILILVALLINYSFISNLKLKLENNITQIANKVNYIIFSFINSFY